MSEEVIRSGAVIQHRKVGRATLIEPETAYGQELHPDGSGWWLVQFTTGPHRNKGPAPLWIEARMVISTSEGA